MTDKSDFWICNPEMKAEWEKFAGDCLQSQKNDISSEQWQLFFTRPIFLKKMHKRVLQLQSLNVQDESLSNEASNSGSSSKNVPLPPIAETEIDSSTQNTVSEAPLHSSQQQHINSLALELVDIFDIGNATLSEELTDDLQSLPSRAIQHLLVEMASHLSSQGVYNLCESLTQMDENPWLDVHSVIQYIIFPMVCGDPPKPTEANLSAGIVHLSSKFPSLCASSLLKPLFDVPSAAAVQLDLVSRLIPSLPSSDFLLLLRQFVGVCNGILEEWQLSILNTFLLKLEADTVNTTIESILLDLLPVLSASATQMSKNESFWSLLLKIILCLKSSVSQKVYAELSSIAHQSKSFSRRTILNAVKRLRLQ